MPHPVNALTDTFSDRTLARFFWGSCMLGWVGLIVTTTTTLSAIGYFDVSVALMMALSVWTPYVAFVPVVFALSRRFPVGAGERRIRNVAAHVVACAVFIAACETAFYSCMRLVRPRINQEALERYRRQDIRKGGSGDGSASVVPMHVSLETGELILSPRMLMFKTQFDIPLYCFLVAFTHALQATAALRARDAHTARLREQLAKAQLAELKTQLQPHFLFNALNSISALIPHDPRMANEMLLNLSDLLRTALRQGQEHTVTLAKELDLLERYVGIQKIRFGERLDFAIDADWPAREALVPPLLLQPLVENAIRHGVEPSEDRVQVRVFASASAEQLEIEVRNSGCSPDEGAGMPNDEGGIGLPNTQSRLQACYGGQQSFEVTRQGGAFRVRLCVPMRPIRPTGAES